MLASRALLLGGGPFRRHGFIGESINPRTAVLSTLAIAALFSPLRRRIQNLIEKRFYRQNYDARQTLTVFAVKMRDEVELDRLSETLRGVVDKTMQPAHASLWFLKSE